MCGYLATAFSIRIWRFVAASSMVLAGCPLRVDVMPDLNIKTNINKTYRYRMELLYKAWTPSSYRRKDKDIRYLINYLSVSIFI
jgi:hypothetical protein